MKFTHEQIPNLFIGARSSDNNRNINCDSYYFSDGSKDIMEVLFLGDNEWRFIIDNFPCQRKSYSTNFPIKTTERFISEMKHIGINIELKK